MYVTESLNPVAVRHRKGKSKNVTPQNSISLVYKILEVIAGLIFDNILTNCQRKHRTRI